MYYFYYTKFLQIGVFFIRSHAENPKHWDLYINSAYLGSYIAPEIAADAVFSKQTNYNKWDNLNSEPIIPRNLADWTKVDDNYQLI